MTHEAAHYRARPRATTKIMQRVVVLPALPPSSSCRFLDLGSHVLIEKSAFLKLLQQTEHNGEMR